MRKPPSPLLAILRSRLQGDVLASVYLSRWDAPISISDLARELGQPISSVHAETRRLLDAGLLSEIKVGRTRLVAPPDDDLVTRALRELLAVTFGPLPVLRDLLAGIDGVDEAYIYGSWAARYLGQPGPVPNDVDVLVIGAADVDRLDEIAEEAQRQLHREVNIRQVSPARWLDPGKDPFLLTVSERPLVPLAPTTNASGQQNRTTST